MTNEQALKIVAEFKAVLPSIQKALGQTVEAEKPNPTPTQTAKEYLLEILSKPFEVKITEGFIFYYQDAEWVFRQDLKDGILWCSFLKVWQFFATTYSMKYEQIQALHEEVVCEALNCKWFTPRTAVWQR